MPSIAKPLDSTSVTHFVTTNGNVALCAASSVVNSIPKTPLKYFKSGTQSLGIFSEHLAAKKIILTIRIVYNYYNVQCTIIPQSSHLTPC